MRNRKHSPFPMLSFRWLLLVNTICVVGSVMSYGVVAILFLNLPSNPLSMVWMIPPMLLATGVSTAVTLNAVRKRMELLLDGIQRVADGDLNVTLNPKGAEEYALIYENFNRMVTELRSTKEQMQNFVNEFTHEFKTPITSISGFAQYLLQTGQELETDERKQFLQVIYDESLRLSELSQKTLLLSKVEACQIITEKQTFSLDEQVKRCAIMLLPQMEAKGIVLDTDLPDLTYYGNAELLEQVWLNLLNNALKFTPEGGKISMHGEDTGAELCIKIADTGIGMDEETCRHIFEKYYQHDPSHATRGNGIGLSIVARVVTLCGGRIDVQSTPGKGSRFAVSLPK